MASLSSRASTPSSSSPPNPYHDDLLSAKPHCAPTPTESTLDCEIEEPVPGYYPQSRWRRILGAVFRGQSVGNDSEGALPLLSSNAFYPRRTRKPLDFKLSYCLLVPLLGFFVML